MKILKGTDSIINENARQFPIELYLSVYSND